MCITILNSRFLVCLITSHTGGKVNNLLKVLEIYYEQFSTAVCIYVESILLRCLWMERMTTAYIYIRSIISPRKTPNSAPNVPLILAKKKKKKGQSVNHQQNYFAIIAK